MRIIIHNTTDGATVGYTLVASASEFDTIQDALDRAAGCLDTGAGNLLSDTVEAKQTAMRKVFAHPDRLHIYPTLPDGTSADVEPLCVRLKWDTKG
ncbi:hypothetical protein [Nocardiopsis nanhaiensis]